ncbi:hypothetical protein [Pantoea cypripedii]|nr:hypothetical protein [Pantoea cypripedii]
MNITPTTSGSSSINTELYTAEHPITQMNEHVATVTNSTESLSSFETEMQQILPREIITRIFRTLHPTRQAEHVWRYFLPSQYSQLLDLSTKNPEIGILKKIIRIIPFIPQAWQHDAIKAVCENFIKRIDEFPVFCAVIEFIITNKKSDSHSFMLMMQTLIEQVGDFKVNDDFWGADHALLSWDPIEHQDSEGNICYEMANLSLLKISSLYNLELLELHTALFARETIKFNWKIKDLNSENPEIKTKTNEEKSLNREIKRTKQQIKNIVRKKNATDCAALSYKTVYKPLQPGSKNNHYEIRDINEIINLFNTKKHQAADIINRHVFELIISTLDQNASRMTSPDRENLRVKLVNSMEKLTQSQRHSALSCLIKSDSSTPEVLAILAKKLDGDFFAQPFVAMALIANKMEVSYNNNEDVSHVIAALRSYIAPRLEEIRNFLTFFHLISRDCQNLLLNDLL